MYTLTRGQYFQALREGRLLGLKCSACGGYTTPPKVCCDICGSREVKVTELTSRGVVKTFTVVRVPPEGLAAPYIVAMVELPEGPWLVGNVEGVGPDDADMGLIGQEVDIGYRPVTGLAYTSLEGITPVFTIRVPGGD